MEGEINSSKASSKDEAGVDRHSGGATEEHLTAKDEVRADSLPGGAPKEESLMDWELSGKVGEATKIVSEVPAMGGGGAHGDEVDVESFSFASFGSDSEEGSEGGVPPDASPVPELSKAFDLKILQTVIEASTPALDTVSGKHVVMVTGKTGVGKSTLIQGIAGKKILKTEHKTSFSGEVALKTVFDAADALPAFEIGHTMKSKTSSVNALLRGKGDAEIVYLDSPGFEDTSGIEMDIATSAVLSQVAKRCKSLRFVILIHCASLLEDRGGAFRSVLKFARTFVQDFNQSKLSFIFLFTHTDEITGMSISVGQAKKRLQEEIIQISEGTTDEDVLMVLDFIRRSLVKNYLSASIFHPIEMDYLKLTSFIEKKLKKVTDLSIASSCNLTLSSKLKLESAVQSLVQCLRVALRESSQDVEQVKEIEKRLQYLSNYIDVDCVRNAAADSKAIINEYTEHLNSSIKGLLCRGTSSDLEFNEEHIQALKVALSQLQELGATRTPTHHLHVIERCLLKFQDEIVASMRSLELFHTELNKVSIWAKGFDDFAPIYAALCETINEYVQGLSTAPSKVDVPNLDKVSHDDVGIFLFHLYKLNAMCEQLTQFHVAGIDTESAVLARDSMMQALSDVFKSWTADAENFSNALNFVDYEDDLQVIISRVVLLEFIQEFLPSTLKDHSHLFPWLENHVIDTKKGLEDAVSRRFNQCCTQLKGGTFDLSWKSPLLWMQAVCDGFADTKGVSGKQMQSSLFSVIDVAKSALYKASGELENMSHMIKVHGMTSGENLAEELIYLERCKWLDALLSPDEHFVETCSNNVRSSIDAWIKEKHRELDSVVYTGGNSEEEELEFNVSDNTSGKEMAPKKRKSRAKAKGKNSTGKRTKKQVIGSDNNSDTCAPSYGEKDEPFAAETESEMEFESKEEAAAAKKKKGIKASNFSLLSPGSSKSIKDIGLMLPELCQIDSYSRVANTNGTLLSLTATCVACIERYVSDLDDLSTKCIGHWTSNVEKGRIGYMRSITRKLNHILADVEALLTTNASEIVTHKSHKTRSKLHSEFKKFNGALKKEFASFGGSFDEKVAFLVSVKACIGFTHVESQCVEYKKLKDCVRDLVSKHAAKLEGAIGATSDWDQIDKDLDKFSSSAVLDPFVSDEVSTRLHTLRRLREQKEEQVNDLMQDMIQNRNFKGISEFLRPLSRSTDQLKKSLFQQHQILICCSLEETVNEIYRLLDDDAELVGNSKRVAENMDILVAAKSELGFLLSSRFSFAFEMPRLKERITSIFSAFTRKITDATNNLDFIQMQVNCRQGYLFLTSMEKHLPAIKINFFHAARGKSKRTAEAIPQYLDKFFKSRFEDGNDLFKVMDSLKRAAEVGSYPKLVELYETTKKDIESKSLDTMKLVETVISEYQCYDDLIHYTHSLHRHLQGSLRDHCSSDLAHQCERLIEDLRRKKKINDSILDFGGGDYERNIKTLSQQLHRLRSTPRWSYLWDNRNATHGRLCNILREKIKGRFNQAQIALKARDLVSVQECLDFLELLHANTQKHVKDAGRKIEEIRDMCIRDFLKLCDEAKYILDSDNVTPFKEIFPDYRGFVINIPCVSLSPKCQKKFALVNQLLYESLDEAVSKLRQLTDAESFNSSRLRSQVLYTRLWGNFVADRVTLLHEEINVHTDFKPDKWLGRIHTLCWEHFNYGRDLSKMKDCVILGVLPSATKSDVDKAFKEKALCYHPDKLGPLSDSAMFRKIKDSQENMLTMSHLTISTQTQPLDEILIGVGEKLRDQAKLFMLEQRYDMAEKLLFELANIKVLDDLVTPHLKSDDVKLSIYSLVKGYIEKARVEVDSDWSARKYKELNNIITDLQKMECHFKAYPQIFPKSWDTGICHTVETEIELLGQKASACLTSRSLAKQKEGDFRRCFIQMGFVLVELPLFKAFTKSVMSGVLERCLDSDWGYSYLFELGLSLQKGDGSSSDNENRVAQMIVTEFNHFKEVMTMVWNEETSQKPAQDVVMHIKGNHYTTPTQVNSLDIDRNQLLESFRNYEREYKSLLGDYIKPEADLNVLVNKTLTLAKQVMPSHNGDEWGEDLKQKIPILLAGVFSLFTVLKSGASYNRIEAAAGSSNLGEKLLMKPHSIQVLTLLFMLGCGKSGQTLLESQLMQIRTGEGKSMILGAAAIIFALLGFKVRTVCYSEYLSTRDFKLFEEVFDRYGLTKYIKYSKITTCAEDSTAAKGDIRSLTEALLRGTLTTTQPSTVHSRLGGSNVQLGGNIHHEKALNNEHSFKSSDLVPSSKAAEGGKDGSSSDMEPQSTSDLDRSSNDSVVHHSNSESASVVRPINSKTEPSSTLSHQTNANIVAVSTEEVKLGNVKLATDERKEILLVDEVDVFFGSGFYGQTYNQVVEFREPEIEEILRRIWNAFNQGGRRLKLSDVKSMPEYGRLRNKLASFSFLLDNELLLMLDQVSKVDNVPYYLDLDNDRIGYKVMDGVSYDVTYGYATVFTYLKEHQKLKNKGTLSKVLAMPVSCGQFSYANIHPHKILGVSGTLEALGESERDILLKYGLSRFIYVPSVYGASNFVFDKAGNGIYFENNKSDFFHRISAEIASSTKSKQGVIVFFHDRAKLDEFVASPTYHQLSRHKTLLKEDMNATDKGYTINKAATAGQITLSTAVFGRGTDFFCKDDVVQQNGGVHIIQTFLSEQRSEEIQIQGRTARQGKKGSYQMVLLESDLESAFGILPGGKDKVPKKDVYDWLCSVRMQKHKKQCKLIEENLSEATEKDSATHKYFNRLLDCNTVEATKEFEVLYHLIKKAPTPSSLILDLAFAIDVTGSMAPYSNCIVSTIESLISGQNSILEKLKSTFPEIEFKLRVGCLGFRDIDDNNQFHENVWSEGGHFTDNIARALQGIKSTCQNVCGGADIAEDHIGAIHHCATDWNDANDWTSDIKCLMLLSDAPSHGLVVPSLSGASNYDSYPTRHPSGLTLGDAASSLISKDIDLFFCSFDPNSTVRTEEELSKSVKEHPDNKSPERGITQIPMVPKGQHHTNGSSFNRQSKHVIFVLDESGSMARSWSGVVDAYRKYIEKRVQSQSDSDLVSVVQFACRSRITVNMQSLSAAPQQLSQNIGGTFFYPAALDACKLARGTPAAHTPVIVFMSDGGTSDAAAAAQKFSKLNTFLSQESGNSLELHVIAFGSGASQTQLQLIAGASSVGKVHASANTADLANVFVSIATNQNVATLLESEISKRMSEAVSDKLSLEYFGS